MNTNSNTYTVIYATVLVVIVAAVLAFVSVSLKDRQQKNIDIETKQSILKSVNLLGDTDKEADLMKYVEERYDKYITDSYVVNSKGEKIEGDAFRISLKSQYDILKQEKPNYDKLTLPVYVCTLDNGDVINIFSVYGAGLWGPIWGYVSLKNDFNTLYGATFGHKGETPGLGAEIATDHFSNQFIDKTIFENGTFSSVAVVKGGAQKGNTHQVDAISGGTITSKSLENTIKMWLNQYLPYIQQQKNKE
jgi:Na+-transporting NADH:ubiquinone oxidoreductase subunit C